MSEGRCSILVDTNVWLNNYLSHEKGYAAARSFFAAAASGNALLLYPASTLKDVFHILRQRFKQDLWEANGTLPQQDALAIRNIAWACIDNMRTLGTAVGMDESDLWLACKYRRLNPDLEDNLVLAAAERAHANFLVTSDEQLLRKSTVTAFSPADMALYLEARAAL